MKLALTVVSIACVLALLALGLRAQNRAGADPLAQKAQKATPAAGQKLAKATFAGGCFWCMEPPYDKLPGVISTTSGYTGGRVKNPSYEQVSAGGTGHAEAVEIVYDPSKVAEIFGLAAYGGISGALALCTTVARTLAPLGAALLHDSRGSYQPVFWLLAAGALGAAGSGWLAERSR